MSNGPSACAACGWQAHPNPNAKGNNTHALISIGVIVAVCVSVPIYFAVTAPQRRLEAIAAATSAENEASRQRAQALKEKNAEAEEKLKIEMKRQEEQIAHAKEQVVAQLRDGTGSASDDDRQTLANLSRNPLALKPTKVSPPDEDEPDHTTYEYTLPGIGDVLQWKRDANRWEIFLANKTSPNFFAPESGLNSLADTRGVRWWRVTAGPFRGGFVERTPGGIGVRSKQDVCSVRGGLPAVMAECAGN